MSGVIWDVSMSLDGFIAQPDDDPGRLHDWIFKGNDDRACDAPDRAPPA